MKVSIISRSSVVGLMDTIIREGTTLNSHPPSMSSWFGKILKVRHGLSLACVYDFKDQVINRIYDFLLE